MREIRVDLTAIETSTPKENFRKLGEESEPYPETVKPVTVRRDWVRLFAGL